MTLSPLSPAALNAKSPSSLASPYHKSQSKRDVETIDMGNMDNLIAAQEKQHTQSWTEESSSSFQSQLQPEEGEHTTKDILSEAQQQFTSSQTSSSSSKLSTPFEICEDDTASMMLAPRQPQLTTSALARAMKRKTMSPVKSYRASSLAVSAMSSPKKQLITEERVFSKGSWRRSLQHLPAVDTEAFRTRPGRLMTCEEVQYTAKASILSETPPSTEMATGTITPIAEVDDAVVDDTCFSTFSEVPNMDMTKFASLGKHSPSKLHNFVSQTPRDHPDATPSTVKTSQRSRSSSPTPRAGAKADSDTTTLLLDFTQQFEAISTLSHKLRTVSRRSMSPTKTDMSQPPLRSYLDGQRSPRKSVAQGNTSTPSNKNLLTLLDFELPPAPSPRSAPSISVRELESLKSNYASQISALKATLSGREAEVESLKRAVGDAERRVGEAAEELREEKGRRECAEREKDEWIARGSEFEDVLRQVKKEVLEGEKEREEVVTRAEDAEEKVRELQNKVYDLEERARIAEAQKAELAMSTSSGSAKDEHKGPMFTLEQVQKQIDEKVHILSTELHAIYKKKHITKVAGLKKGFEAKTKEKTEELAAQIEKLERKNEDLQAKLDGTLSGVVSGLPLLDGVSSEQHESDLKQLEEQKVIIERQKAELAGREEELKTQRAEFGTVMAELERERIEKGELVAAVDEMLALQSDMSVVHAAASEPLTAPLVEEALRKSVGIGAGGAGVRPSGLAKPGFGFGGPSRLAKPMAGKSRMMSQIEKMGGGGRMAE